MAYKLGKDGLLDFSGCETVDEKIEECWDYYQKNLGQPEIVAYDGKLVRGFTEWTFEHVITASTNKWDTALGHDAGFSERRAECLPLIPRVINGSIRSHCWRVARAKNGKKVISSVLSRC